VTEIP